MPIFWWGLILILFMSNTLGLTPVSGRMDLIKYYFEPTTGFMLIDTLFFVGAEQKGAFLDAVRHLILPTIVLGTVPLAVIARMTRSAMLEVLQEDYVRTARAKGLPPRRVIGQHALRNALIPVVTTIGLQVTTLFGGAVLTETIFAWPGVGKWLIESIGRRDYPALQGGIMLISGLVVFVNLVVDMLYGLINPRIRHG
jgi:dipeptide transport system permease protein